MPDIDRSLDEESAKRDFWRAFRSLGRVVERLPAVLRLAELQRIDVAGTIMRPIRRPLGVTAFGINAYTGDAEGDLVIEPHDELDPGGGRHEELYVVVTGHATFELDGDELDAPAGTLVFVQPEQHRSAHGARGRHDRARDRRQAGRGGPAVAVRVLLRGRRAKSRRGRYEICAEGLEHYPDNAGAAVQPRLLRGAGRAARGRAAAHRDRVRAGARRPASGPRTTRTWTRSGTPCQPKGARPL